MFNKTKKILAIVLAISLTTLTACNTVKGFGRDVERGGEAIQKAAN